MAPLQTLCIAALPLLTAVSLIHVGQFLSNEVSMLKHGMFSAASDEQKNKPSACVESPNRTIIQREDLELSCAEFRRMRRYTVERAFSHLGAEAVKDARDLRKRIQEQQRELGAVRIAIGTGPGVPEFGNFIVTDYPIVDILNATRLSALLQESSVEAIFACHVWEHFTYPQAIQALHNVRCLMTDNAIARFGVPDAAHPDQIYHEKKVREGFPDGKFKADYRFSFYSGHGELWTERKCATAASMTGLNARPLEWWSSSESELQFCYNDYNDFENGRINRSPKYDKRNTKENPYAYTSLIVDLSPQILE